MSKIFTFIKCPVAMLASVMAISVAALLAAFGSEAFLGLEPCQLCIYQRWPFAIVILLGVIGIAFRKVNGLSEAMVGVSGVAFLTNAAIAGYHTGVEQKWWRSAFEGCAVPNWDGDEPQSLLDNILSAPTGRCDEISWQDPLFGLSMANYNVLMGLGLAALCFLSLYLHKRYGAGCVVKDADCP